MNADNDVDHGNKDNGKENFVTTTDNEDLDKEGYGMKLVTEKYSQLDVNDSYEFGPFGTVDREFLEAEGTEVEGEGHGLDDELHLYSSHEDEYDIFELRIIHRKNRFKSQNCLIIVMCTFMLKDFYSLTYHPIISGLALKRIKICQSF